MTGIYRATPLRVSSRQRNVRSVFKTYVDVIHFRKTDTNRLHRREDEDEEEGEGKGEGAKKAFSEERMAALRHLSQMPDIYERLARALGKDCLMVAMR